MKEIFSNQKIHDVLEAVNESLDMHTRPENFYAIYEGQVYQNGNVEEILGRLFRTFPEFFTELAVENLTEKLNASQADDADSADPTNEAYWEQSEPELGVNELELFKRGLPQGVVECLDTVQLAVSLCNEQGLIDDDGCIIGRDLLRVLRFDLHVNLVNFGELDEYLENFCGNLLTNELVTIGKHKSDGRTRTYGFLNSPFKLY